MSFVADIDPKSVWRVLVDALDILPGAELIDRDDWVQLRTPSSRVHNHNKILRAKLAPEEVDTRVAQVLAEHAERGASLQWWVDEDSQPDDLGERLRAAGLTLTSHTLGMVRDVPEPPYPKPPTGVTVRPAGADDCALIGRATAAAWGQPPAFGLAAADLARRVFAGEATGVAFWFAYDHGRLAGVTMLRTLPELGYLQGAAVMPASRGKGIYRALTWARLAELQRLGHKRVVLWANPQTSGPPAKKMGFKTVARAAIFAWECPSARLRRA